VRKKRNKKSFTHVYNLDFFSHVDSGIAFPLHRLMKLLWTHRPDIRLGKLRFDVSILEMVVAVAQVTTIERRQLIGV